MNSPATLAYAAALFLSTAPLQAQAPVQPREPPLVVCDGKGYCVIRHDALKALIALAMALRAGASCA